MCVGGETNQTQTMIPSLNDGREIQGGTCSAWTELGRRGKQKLRDLFQKGEHGYGKPRLTRVGAGKLPEHAELEG